MFHFIQAVSQSKPADEDFVDGYIANMVIDAAYRSANSRQWEPVNFDL